MTIITFGIITILHINFRIQELAAGTTRLLPLLRLLFHACTALDELHRGASFVLLLHARHECGPTELRFR